MRPKLISYKLCPYVHKAAIALRAKDIPYDIAYIDLSTPPQWFRDISPLGKVPLLLVENEELFESTAIVEYLDDVYFPRLHPAEPLKRARNRAWMALVDACLGAYYRLVGWKSEATFPKALEKLHACFDQLEPAVTATPFFNGETFSLVDATFAPLFFQLNILAEMTPNLFDNARHPRIVRWKNALIAHEAIVTTVVPDFRELYLDWLSNKESVLARRALAED